MKLTSEMMRFMVTRFLILPSFYFKTRIRSILCLIFLINLENFFFLLLCFVPWVRERAKENIELVVIYKNELTTLVVDIFYFLDNKY